MLDKKGRAVHLIRGAPGLVETDGYVDVWKPGTGSPVQAGTLPVAIYRAASEAIDYWKRSHRGEGLDGMIIHIRKA